MRADELIKLIEESRDNKKKWDKVLKQISKPTAKKSPGRKKGEK